MSDKKSNGISILAKPKNTRSSKKKTKKLKSAEINRENVSTSKAHDFWSSIDNKGANGEFGKNRTLSLKLFPCIALKLRQLSWPVVTP
jgi:hypothetical protein